MNKLKVGLIGCLGGARLAKQCHSGNLMAEVVAGTDVSLDNLEVFKQEYQEEFNQSVNGYLDYREMVEKENLDAVMVMTPDHFHEEHAQYVIEHELPVFLEKPLSISVESCDRIISLAEKRKVKLMIGHNMRHMWFTNKMKEIVDSGVIGKVQAIWVRHFVSYGAGYFQKWYSEREHVNGLLLQKGAHDIDIIHWLGGAYTKRVSAFGNLSVYDTLPRREPNTPPPVYENREKN